MLSPGLVESIARRLEAGEPIRRIHRDSGTSRAVIRQIQRGARPDYAARGPRPRRAAPHRCGCGALITTSHCVRCAAEAYRRLQAGDAA